MTQTVHPRPQLERTGWRSLNGKWRFAYDDEARYRQPSEVPFDRTIVVPFPPESPASGVHQEGFHPVIWYATTVQLKADERRERLILHFGAVDYEAHVWINGKFATMHRGGHTPFSVDITEAVKQTDTLEIALRAEDYPHDLAKPRGKQDWLEKPHDIWYPRTTGIWQSVWIEPIAETHILQLAWTPHLERWEIGMEALLNGPIQPSMHLRVCLRVGDTVLADDRYLITHAEVPRRIALVDPGIDNYRNHLLWSPEHPILIDAVVELWHNDTLIDRVKSYTALRSVGISGNNFMLNGRPYYLRMVLDQGYWTESLLAAPDEDALRRDVEHAKQLGFNGIRKHQKVEDPRWLYWCDAMGMLVWGEMPSTYRFTPTSVERLVTEWMEVIRRDYSHPCIIAWVPLNESWGVPDLPTNPAHRDYVRALFHLTKTLDPTRPVIGNDGWEHVATDIIGIHDYTSDSELLLERYETLESTEITLKRFQPGGRALTLAGFVQDQHPIVISEFGGIAFAPHGDGGWGYSRVKSSEEFLAAYRKLLQALHGCQGIAGFCYTQLTDTFQEKNGLLFDDRTPKADMTSLAQATRATGSAFADHVSLLPNPFEPVKRRKPGKREPLR